MTIKSSDKLSVFTFMIFNLETRSMAWSCKSLIKNSAIRKMRNLSHRQNKKVFTGAPYKDNEKYLTVKGGKAESCNVVRSSGISVAL